MTTGRLIAAALLAAILGGAAASAQPPVGLVPIADARRAPPPFVALNVVATDPTYRARQKRLETLVADAASRATPTATRRPRYDDALFSRNRCGSRACLNAWYARQETALSKWEGGEEILAQRAEIGGPPPRGKPQAAEREWCRRPAASDVPDQQVQRRQHAGVLRGQRLGEDGRCRRSGRGLMLSCLVDAAGALDPGDQVRSAAMASRSATSVRQRAADSDMILSTSASIMLILDGVVLVEGPQRGLGTFRRPARSTVKSVRPVSPRISRADFMNRAGRDSASSAVAAARASSTWPSADPLWTETIVQPVRMTLPFSESHQEGQR